MTKAVLNLSEEQLDFVCSEFNIDKEQLLSMTDDEIYDNIYDPCCIIEEVEIVATLDDDSELSQRGALASSIVTVLGEAIDEE